MSALTRQSNQPAPWLATEQVRAIQRSRRVEAGSVTEMARSLLREARGGQGLRQPYSIGGTVTEPVRSLMGDAKEAERPASASGAGPAVRERGTRKRTVSTPVRARPPSSSAGRRSRLVSARPV